uniref:CSON014849 protein n=1 Tax=Culicoides sonorensis TaxID=179676 RepID=A0A336MC39_CULSO
MDEVKLKQIAGQHGETYEGYFLMVDTDHTGIIQAAPAAKFLMKSGLSDVILSRIWDLSDPNGRGCLDKLGFYTALKLIALTQNGEQMKVANLAMETKAPKLGEIPNNIKQMINRVQCIPVGTIDWSIQPQDRVKYEGIFESLNPENGIIPGNKVRGKLMESKLPLEILGRIWDLADQDKDGSLDKHEFVVAWHLVVIALGRRIVPDKLPPVLHKTAKPSTDEFVAVFPDRISPPPAVPPLPAVLQKQGVPGRPPVPSQPASASLIDIGGPLLSSSQIVPPTTEWVVTTMQKLRYDEIFEKSDQDHDGLVSGGEIKDVFLKSGLPTKVLAEIWNLCDTSSCGKLTREQFALAMWMVERKQKENIDPPKQLAPNMIPPSLRPKVVVPPPTMAASAISAPLISGLPPSTMPLIPDDPPQPTYSNPELQMISEDIQKLAKERRQLELEVAQKEADIKIKGGEVRSLESELKTLAATLKQLEYQKGEAQKRIDDLRSQVDKVREQCHKQEEVLKETESEVDIKRAELQKLKEEEQELQKESDDSQRKLELLSRILQDTQLQISQVKAMLTQLEETKRQMTDSLALCKAAIEQNDPGSVPDYSLNLEPELHDAKKLLEDKPDPTLSPEKPAPVASNVSNNGFQERFDTNDSWDTPATGGFGFDDSFSNSFTPKPAATANDPFAPAAGTTTTKSDAFDPFASLHAPKTAAEAMALTPSPSRPGPPGRPESPSPALPPKKAKPMRPPPPRPAQGPTRSKSPASDAFGDSFSGNSSGFANFADFDNKQIHISSQVQMSSSQLRMPSPSPVQVTSQTLPHQKTSQKTGDNPFSDDPFKNYRYEDVFNIEDPFADEGPAVKETFPEPTTIDITNNNNNNIQDFFKTLPNRPTNFFDDFDDDFTSKTLSNGNSKKKSNTTNSDPFGDKKFSSGTLINNNSTGFNDNFNPKNMFGDDPFKMDSSVKSSKNSSGFGDFDDNFNTSSPIKKETKPEKRNSLNKGYAKPNIKPRPPQDTSHISKQDFSDDQKFLDDIAVAIERSKLEK